MLLKIGIIFLILLEQFQINLAFGHKLQDWFFKKNPVIASEFEKFQDTGTQSANVLFNNLDLLSLSPLPTQISFNLPTIKAQSALILDLETSLVLYQKESKNRLPPASLTKLMTALIVLEEANLEDIVTISQKAVIQEGHSAGLKVGEKVRVKELLYTLLLSSSNDAAVALAEHITGSEEKFVKEMNKKAQFLGLKNTQFANSSGLDDSQQYSTASDLAQLSSYLIKTYPLFNQIIGTKEYILKTAEGRVQNLINSNQLLGLHPNVEGGKTGLTDKAGQCLLTLVRKGNHEVIIVVLSSPRRFSETRILIDWIYQAYKW